MGGQGSGRRPNPHKMTAEDLNDYRSSKVVQLFAHPRLDTIPDPDFPLNEAGKAKYRELAEMLLKAGQLTIITKGMAESAALAHGEMFARLESGKSVSANLISRYQSALGQISLLDVDKNTPGATAQKQNRFRHSGFAQRLR